MVGTVLGVAFGYRVKMRESSHDYDNEEKFTKRTMTMKKKREGRIVVW